MIRSRGAVPSRAATPAPAGPAPAGGAGGRRRRPGPPRPGPGGPGRAVGAAPLRRAAPDVAPLICVDQEGGPIRILPWAAPERAAPAQQAWDAVREDALAAGRDLRAAGISVT